MTTLGLFRGADGGLAWESREGVDDLPFGSAGIRASESRVLVEDLPLDSARVFALDSCVAVEDAEAQNALPGIRTASVTSSATILIPRPPAGAGDAAVRAAAQPGKGP